MLAVSLALARLLVENGSAAPQLAEDAVLLVQRDNVDLGCQPGDPPPDAGPGDAGTPDAGADAGVDAGCEPLVGPAISMVIRPRFSTSPAGTRFALLFVTAGRPVVATVADPFPALEALTAPKTEVHFTEIPDPALGTRCGGGGCGFGSPSFPGEFDPPDVGDANLGDGAVVVEPVGPYEIVRVQPADTTELQALLTSFNYVVQQEDLDALAPYIERGFTVVALRVAADQTDDSLVPISMTWPGTVLRLPLALGGADPSGLSVYIAGKGRLELPGAEVSFAGFTFGGDTEFLTRNDLSGLEVLSPDDDPIAMPIAGNPEFQIVNVVEKEKRVPIDDCGDVELGCCNTAGGPRADFGLLGIVVALALRRRRRARSTPTSSR